MSQLNLSIESVLIDLWHDLFYSLAEYLDHEIYDEVIDMKIQLVDDGELNSTTSFEKTAVLKFNKMVFICTQIVDFNGILKNKFKNHLEKFNITLIEKDFRMRYRNKIALSRTIYNTINFNKDLSKIDYWDKALSNISKQSMKNINMAEATLVITCENHLQIIAKLNDIIKNVMNDTDEFKTALDSFEHFNIDEDNDDEPSTSYD
ncbi:P5 [Arceuthobium sichuanense virus 1]|uniref:P5 n=1 Tax=Arceuthobium sichuanense-associated virus 1 TaxID=3070160 RepID=A0AA48SF48_9VIRU|nr:P5 [Arceuthobium sichuanense virus 1]DAZ87276.1 TPA_asm: P5 [Arceuthobium sichuanense-associated virus 1]